MTLQSGSGRRGYKYLFPSRSDHIMHWNSKEQAFAVEAYFTNGCSVIATQRDFCNRFNLAPSDSLPNHKSIIPRVTTFRHTASATRTGVPWPIRSPENIEAVTGGQSCNHHGVLRANMCLPLDFLIVQWGEFFTMIFITSLTRCWLCRNSLNVT